MDIIDAPVQINADSEATIKAYVGCMKQLEQHLNRKLYSMELFEDGDARQNGIVPIEMHELLEFLELKRIDGRLSKSRVQGFKAAVSKFRSRNGFSKFSLKDETSLKRYTKGLGTMIRQAIRDGEASARHLKPEELKFLCSYSLQHYEKVCSFKYGTEIHLFLLLGWHLCAQTNTTSFIHASHLDWEGDCMKIGIAKSKRSYNTSAVYYHVYANPLDPYVCPVLSLAVHIVCNRTIFSEQQGLFRQTRSRNQGVVNLFARLADIGSYSIRKGSITYASTGAPDVLPSDTVSVRSRWKGSEFSASGDQLCGRVLALLPMQSKDFAVLPPHVVTTDAEVVARFEKINLLFFGDAQNAGTRRVIPFLTYSLIYHYDFIKENYSQGHPIHNSVLFRGISSAEIRTLKDYVVIHSDALDARGVPSSVAVLKELEELRSELRKIRDRQATMQADTEKLVESIPHSATASGLMFSERQLKNLKESIGNHIVAALNDRGISQEVQREQPSISNTDNRRYSVFTWSDGSSREIPQDFEIMRQKAKPVDAWNRWWKGYWVGDQRIKSYKVLVRQNRNDIRDAYNLRQHSWNTARRAIREMSLLMGYFETVCKETDEIKHEYQQLLESHTVANVNEELVASVWRKCWAKVLHKLDEDFLKDAQEANKTRRKHDLSRCTLRTIHSKLKL